MPGMYDDMYWFACIPAHAYVKGMPYFTEIMKDKGPEGKEDTQYVYAHTSGVGPDGWAVQHITADRAEKRLAFGGACSKILKIVEYHHRSYGWFKIMQDKQRAVERGHV